MDRFAAQYLEADAVRLGEVLVDGEVVAEDADAADLAGVPGPRHQRAPVNGHSRQSQWSEWYLIRQWYLNHDTTQSSCDTTQSSYGTTQSSCDTTQSCCDVTQSSCDFNQSP